MRKAVEDLGLYLRCIKADKYRVNLIPSSERTDHQKPFNRTAK